MSTDLTESKVHSFIIKLWLEGEATSLTWHGQITHVPSGARRYFKTLDEITDFIGQYIECSKTHPGFKSRMRQWLRKRRA